MGRGSRGSRGQGGEGRYLVRLAPGGGGGGTHTENPGSSITRQIDEFSLVILMVSK